jgi:hypothetical protein
MLLRYSNNILLHIQALGAQLLCVAQDANIDILINLQILALLQALLMTYFK